MKFNTLTQIFLPLFTILGFLLTSLKLPQYGLVASLVSQVFFGCMLRIKPGNKLVKSASLLQQYLFL